MQWIGTRTGGALVADDALVISAADRGLTVGEGVFETLTVRSGMPFAFDRHMARLLQSAAIVGLPEPNAAVVRAAVSELLASDGARIGALGRLRITYTAGAAPETPTLLVTCTPIAPLPATTTAITSKHVRNERSAVAGAKTTAYVENLVAQREAQAAGATEAIMGNTRGLLCEGTASNVIVVIEGRALTPSLSSGCLPGVTRSLVLDWCDVTEAELPLDVLVTADEVLLTSATRGVQVVTRLDDRVLGLASVGTRMQRDFAAHLDAGSAQ